MQLLAFDQIHFASFSIGQDGSHKAELGQARAAAV